MSLSTGPVGFLGTGPVPAAIEAVCETHDRPVIAGSFEEVRAENPAVWVPSGPRALGTLLARSPHEPVCPLAIPETEHDPDAVGAQLSAGFQGRGRLHSAAVLAVTGVETPEVPYALFDVTVMTAEPARISEYDVTVGDGDAARRLMQVRADGLVVTTPIGSEGYGRRVGTPELGPDVEALAVTPISPFRVARTAHVTTPPLGVRLAREEGEVELFVDGRRAASLVQEEPVTIRWAEPITILRTDEKT